MKRIFYMIFMMIFFVLISLATYFCLIFSFVYYHIVNCYQIISFTDISLSYEAYILAGCIGLVLGYIFGKKWWQIIYVDKVYWFDKSQSSKRIATHGRRVTKK